MCEEESSGELVIASAGLSRPVKEVVAIRPDDEVGVEFRRNELSVNCLVLAFFFVAILFVTFVTEVSLYSREAEPRI
jgi:hypothetical protein